MRCSVLLCVTSVIVTLSVPFEVSKQLLAAERQSIYKVSDKNGDNRIDREEYHQRMTDLFFFTDVDKDRHLSPGELQHVSSKRFKTADHNRDGKLSLFEYINARFKDFDAADRDRDGLLSREEVKSR